MQVAIRVNRNVSEESFIEVENFEELEKLVKTNKLFEEIDRQHAEKDDSKVWEETCGEILDSYVEIDGKEYKIDNDKDTLIPLNKYGEVE